MSKIFCTAVFGLLLVFATQIFNSPPVEAADSWVYTNSQGIRIYIERESVVYGVRTSFYAKARVKRVNPSGELIRRMYLEFNRDEGDWWYGEVDVRGDGRRVYDDEEASEILNWLRAHQNEARKTANPCIKVLGD